MHEIPRSLRVGSRQVLELKRASCQGTSSKTANTAQSNHEITQTNTHPGPTRSNPAASPPSHPAKRPQQQVRGTQDVPATGEAQARENLRQKLEGQEFYGEAMMAPQAFLASHPR